MARFWRGWDVKHLRPCIIIERILISRRVKAQEDYLEFNAWCCSQDTIEGITAFAEKRAPVMTNK